MNRVVLGAVLALVFVTIGMFWWQGRAQVEEGAPPPSVEPSEFAPEDLPTDFPSDVHGPVPPEASGLTREQQRFFRYDRNRDLRITRNEMLSTRSDAFRKLDTNGDNLLTFEEWAHVTAERFDKADKNHDGELTQAEFATTATKSTKGKPTCQC